MIAAAHYDGNLKSFLDCVKGTCAPNLTSIAIHGMPTGAGRKGGVAKQTRKRTPKNIVSRSVRPCLEAEGSPILTSTPKSTCSSTAVFQQPSLGTSPTSQLNSSCILPHSRSTTVISPSSSQLASGAARPQVVLPLPSSIPAGPMATTLNASGFLRNLLSQPVHPSPKTPFIMKFKTNQIKICQSCRKNYDREHDTMGLCVARAERRLVSNLATGKQT